MTYKDKFDKLKQSILELVEVIEKEAAAAAKELREVDDLTDPDSALDALGISMSRTMALEVRGVLIELLEASEHRPRAGSHE